MPRRPPNTGQVIHAKAKDRYIARWPLGGGHYLTRTCRTSREAHAALKDLERQARRPQADHSVAGFFRQWLETAVTLDRSANTIRIYRHYIEAVIVPEIGAIPLVAVTPQNIQQLIADAPYGPATVRLIRAILGAGFQQAEAWDLIDRNPVRRSRAPRLPEAERIAPSVEDALRLLAAFPEPPMQGMVTLALCYGLRQSEILGLRWQDVSEEMIQVRGQLDSRRQYRPQRKRGGLVALPMLPIVAEVLEVQRRAAPAGVHVFTGETGHPYNQQYVYRTFKRGLRDLDVPVRTFHDLRHAANSLLDWYGVDLGSRMQILGQRALASNLTYTHTSAARLREGLLRLDQALREGRTYT